MEEFLLVLAVTIIYYWDTISIVLLEYLHHLNSETLTLSNISEIFNSLFTKEKFLNSLTSPGNVHELSTCFFPYPLIFLVLLAIQNEDRKRGGKRGRERAREEGAEGKRKDCNFVHYVKEGSEKTGVKQGDKREGRGCRKGRNWDNCYEEQGRAQRLRNVRQKDVCVAREMSVLFSEAVSTRRKAEWGQKLVTSALSAYLLIVTVELRHEGREPLCLQEVASSIYVELRLWTCIHAMVVWVCREKDNTVGWRGKVWYLRTGEKEKWASRRQRTTVSVMRRTQGLEVKGVQEKERKKNLSKATRKGLVENNKKCPLTLNIMVFIAFSNRNCDRRVWAGARLQFRNG